MSHTRLSDSNYGNQTNHKHISKNIQIIGKSHSDIEWELNPTTSGLTFVNDS